MKWWQVIWAHRTKALGVMMGLAAAIQNTLAQYGHVLPTRWNSILLGVAGMLTFLVGLYNTFSAV